VHQDHLALVEVPVLADHQLALVDQALVQALVDHLVVDVEDSIFTKL